MTRGGWARQTRSGIAWSTLSFASGRAVTFVATLVLARLLTPAEFGVVAAILAFLALLELGSDLGMKATVVYEQERVRSERLDTAFVINLVIAVALCAIGILAAPVIAGFFGIEGEAGLFRLAAISLLITGLANIHDAVLLRDLDFRQRIVPELTRGLVRGGVAIALAFAGFGAEALVWGLLAGQTAWAVMEWVVTGYRPRLRANMAIARSMTSYGATAVALSVVAVLGTRAHVIVVGKLLGPAALGLYTIAARVPELLVSGVSWSFSIVSFPALSAMRALDRSQLEGSVKALVRYQALATVPTAALLAVLAGPAIVVAFSAQWEAAGPVMSAVALAGAIEALGYPLGDLLKALARQSLLLVINVINLPLMVLAMVIVAPAGLKWVAWALVAQSLVHLAMMAGATWRAAGISPRVVAAAAGPALVIAAGVAAGAGAVRVLWPALTIGPLLVGGIAGLAGGALAARLFAPLTWDEGRRLITGALERRRAAAGRDEPAPIVRISTAEPSS